MAQRIHFSRLSIKTTVLSNGLKFGFLLHPKRFHLSCSKERRKRECLPFVTLNALSFILWNSYFIVQTLSKNNTASILSPLFRQWNVFSRMVKNRQDIVNWTVLCGIYWKKKNGNGLLWWFLQEQFSFFQTHEKNKSFCYLTKIVFQNNTSFQKLGFQ